MRSPDDGCVWFCRAVCSVGLWLVSMLAAAPARAQAQPWSATAEFNGASGSSLGQSVAVDARTGALAVFGAPGSNSALVYVSNGMQWSPQATITPGEATTQFGQAVAIADDTVVVGAPSGTAGAPTQGAVYVFVRSGSSWIEQQKLVPMDAPPTTNLARRYRSSWRRSQHVVA